MKLSNSTLQKLIKGACYAKEDKGYLCSYRYSKAQIDYMSQEGYDQFWLRCALISGPQRIEFITDSTSISFDYKTSLTHINANTVDLYVNDVLCSTYHIENALVGKVNFTLAEGKKKVSIYLPCESSMKIKNFTINGTYKSIKDKGTKVLIIGDSITQGAGPAIASLAYANGLARELGYNILAQGIGGYRYEPDDVMNVDGFEPDKIIVALGTNWYDAPDRYDYELNVTGFYKRLSEVFPNVPVLNITPLWRGNADDWDRFIWCINTIKDVCAKYENITVVDGFTLIPNTNDCFSDRIHPNAFGSIMLTTNLVKTIKKLNF